jgi:DNA-binding transcriptional LysR family regulator
MAINLNRYDLATLRLFVLTVEAGSLTAGAARYGISLAAASKRMAELEAHVGGALLARSKRGVQPTPAGQTFHRHAIELVARLEHLAVAMDDLRAGAPGHLRLWANTSAFSRFLPEALAAYSRLHPQVRIDLEDVLSDDAARAVASGATELAVIGENTAVDGLHTLVCDTDALVLMLPAGHALVRRPSVSLDAVMRLDHVALGPATSLTRQVNTAAETVGSSLRVRVLVRSFDAMARMVAAGLGVAVLPSTAAAPHAKALGLVLRPLAGDWTQRRLLLAMRHRATLSAPARAFVDLVEARAAAA